MAEHWEALLHPSGVRRFAGQAGIWYDRSGIIECLRAPYKGIDSHLYAVLKVLVYELQLHLVISSVDTNRHATNSRHYVGLAVDIWKVARKGNVPQVATMNLPAVKELVHHLLAHGFKAGEGRANPGPGLLIGAPRTLYNPSPVDHSDHLHLSLGRK